MKNKVNLFIVGAAKSGTTSLSNYLGQSQYVFMPKIKEPNYFCSDIKFETFRSEFKDDQDLNPRNLDVDRHSAWIDNVDLYKKLYKNNNDYKISIDSSTSYLYSKECPKNIYEYNPNAKIIIILRNPIDRAFSHYLMNLQIGYARKNFKEELLKDINSENKGWGKTHLYAELGMYYSQVSRYLEVFPENQIKIILFDELKNNLSKVMRSICDFLEIEDIQDMDVSRKNVSKAPMMGKLYFLLLKVYKKNRILRIKFLKDLIKYIFLSKSSVPQLKEQDRCFLLSFFRDDICKLSKLIKKDLNNWH